MIKKSINEFNLVLIYPVPASFDASALILTFLNVVTRLMIPFPLPFAIFYNYSKMLKIPLKKYLIPKLEENSQTYCQIIQIVHVNSTIVDFKTQPILKSFCHFDPLFSYILRREIEKKELESNDAGI